MCILVPFHLFLRMNFLNSLIFKFLQEFLSSFLVIEMINQSQKPQNWHNVPMMQALLFLLLGPGITGPCLHTGEETHFSRILIVASKRKLNLNYLTRQRWVHVVKKPRVGTRWIKWFKWCHQGDHVALPSQVKKLHGKAPPTRFPFWITKGLQQF